MTICFGTVECGTLLYFDRKKLGYKKEEKKTVLKNLNVCTPQKVNVTLVIMRRLIDVYLITFATKYYSIFRPFTHA